MKKWETIGCSENSLEENEDITLVSLENSRWTGDKFCYALQKHHLINISGPYQMSVDFRWVYGGKYPTFIFNWQDECNYDHLHKELSYILLNV